MFTWKHGSVCLITANVLLLLILIGVTSHTWTGDIGTGCEQDEDDWIAKSVNQSLQSVIKEDVSTDIKKVQEEIDIFHWNTPKPAGHLVLVSPYNTTGNLVTLNWQHAHNITFLNQGMKLAGGAMVVSAAGYYYIYSQIRYQGSGTQELSYGRILHNVLMQKDSETKESPTTLMQNLLSTPAIRRGRLAFTTSSLGATFFLEANSRVFVNSSIPKHIDSSPSGSYFGMFLM